LVSNGKTPADRFFTAPAYKASPGVIGVAPDYPAKMTPYTDLKQEEDPDDVAALGS